LQKEKNLILEVFEVFMEEQPKTMKITLTVVFAALAIVLEILPIDIPFPIYPKLTIDITGLPLLLTLYLVDLQSATIATIITGIAIALPRPPFKVANPYGAFFKSTAELSTLIGVWITRRFWDSSEKKMVACSLVGGLTARSIAMSVITYIFLPIFYSLPQEVAFSLIPVVIAFNVVQATINIMLAYIVLKAVEKRVSMKDIFKL